MENITSPAKLNATWSWKLENLKAYCNERGG